MALLMPLATFARAADPDMRPGLWEITSRMEMPGMPMQMPAQTHRECLTRQQMVPRAGDEGMGDCKIGQQRISGNTVTWTLECDGGASLRARGEITYRGDSFEGKITLPVKDPDMGAMNMINRISGRHIGKCK